MKNKIIVENGTVKTLFTEETLMNGYMPLDEARRLSCERINKRWKKLQQNGNNITNEAYTPLTSNP